jgi:HEAT repeat protein
MAENKDPQVRLQALLALSDDDKADEDTVQSALDAALTDKDASVRGYAIQVLARRAGPDATGLLWQALRDPDPGVRMRAVNSVVPSNDQGIALLQEVLSDADETVHSLAAFRLKQEVNATGR